ncbi:hypothetical protein B0H14DRAFT_3720657 [Mycena olivaceomarginata]|nr:hypothetical protein B0H14DRAFT_3720657 [Mycena olivaceomarginata]
MLPASHRPLSRASQRPPSSASQRPLSSASRRPPSSLSVRRPPSARIKTRDTLAEALETSYKRLKHQAAQEKDLDQEIKMSRLPDHMQFLCARCRLLPPRHPRLSPLQMPYLEGIKNPPPPPAAESSSSSAASLSPLNSDDLELDDDDDDSFSSLDPEDVAPPEVPVSTAINESSRPPHTYAHRKEFEQLQARQYWREDYVWHGDKGKARAFDIGDASTLGPALQKVLAHEQGSLGAIEVQRCAQHPIQRYIDEQDAVREILMALQGKPIRPPRLIHLSLSSHTHRATIAQQLRTFVAFVFSTSSSQPRAAPSRAPRMTRTLEAFADAVDAELRTFEPMNEFENGLEVLLDIVRATTSYEYLRYALLPRTPAALSALLLDTLLNKVQLHRERGDGRVTADMLMRVFVVCAEPVWGMVGRWLRVGMGLGSGMGVGQGEDLQDEFFIEGSGLAVGLAGSGSGSGSGCLTQIFGRRAVGLLRSLGVPPTADGPTSLSHWRSFARRPVNSLSSVSVETLSQLVYEELAPHCDATGALLGRILVDECELPRHLSSVEDLFLMRKGDAMSNFTDVLFAKMDSHQAWGDFHFLNTASAIGGKEWIQPSLVRLSHRGSTDGGKSVSRTVKAISGPPRRIRRTIFPSRTSSRRVSCRVYGEVFVFVLQIRRAKSMLERILRRGNWGHELKAFYAIRSRLSWVHQVSLTILNFLTTQVYERRIQVIHTQVVKFHDTFNKAKSLDEMIRAHDEHIERIRGRCLLQPNTSALHRAILSILDMSLHFCEVFTTFTGNTTVTLDVSRLSVIPKRHRSRRQRSQRKNIVSFSQAHVFESDESSDDEDEVDLEDEHGDGSSRIDRMATELDGLVRFIRRGVESLAGGTGDAASSFSVLSFSLEDWDL